MVFKKVANTISACSLRLIARLVLLASIVSVSACSWLFGEDGMFPGHSNDYLKAEESADIVLPEGITAESIKSDYPIPELALSQVLPEKFKIPRVEPLDTVDNKGSVRIQRFEGQQWVLVNSAPGQIWPLIASFLTSNNIPLAQADGSRGLIETDWLAADTLNTSNLTDIILDQDDLNQGVVDKNRDFSAKDNTDNKQSAEGEPLNEKYRFVLKAGVQKETTEVLIIQRSRPAVADKDQAANWQNGSSSQLRENNMVKLLSEHLANSPNQASHSLLAQGIGSASHVKLQYDDEGMPYLTLQLPFDRAWASLGLALRKASYQVSDLDRTQGVYYASYIAKVDRPKKRGFFKRIFGIGKRKAKAAEEAIDPVKIQTRHDGQTLIITIQREAEPPLRANEQAFMLRRIQSKLS